MSSRPDLDRSLTEWLAAEARDGAPKRVLDASRARVRETRQRRAWWPAWGIPPINLTVRIVLAAAAVVFVALIGYQLLIAPNVGGPGPAPSPTSSVPVAVRTSIVPAGSDITLSVVLPDGWTTCCGGHAEFSAIRSTTAKPNGMSVYVYAVGNTYAEPCGHVLLSPAVGPTVEDLIVAFGELPNETATAPVDDPIGGLPARYVEITADDPLPCAPNQFYIWADPQGGLNWAQGNGQIVRTWVLEVNGTRITVSALLYPTSTAAAIAEQQALLDSIRFE